MKAVIMSDTHGLEEIINKIYQRHSEAALFIHCGDSELTHDHPYLSPFKTVKGNVDFFDSGFPDQIVEEAGGLKWLVVHGHLDGVNRSPLSLSYKAESIGANVICFGHTHMAGAAVDNGRIFINPGSLRSPRDRLEKTYCVCEWENADAPFKVRFFTEDGQEMKGLSQTFG